MIKSFLVIMWKPRAYDDKKNLPNNINHYYLILIKSRVEVVKKGGKLLNEVFY